MPASAPRFAPPLLESQTRVLPERLQEPKPPCRVTAAPPIFPILVPPPEQMRPPQKGAVGKALPLFGSGFSCFFERSCLYLTTSWVFGIALNTGSSSAPRALLTPVAAIRWMRVHPLQQLGDRASQRSHFAGGRPTSTPSSGFKNGEPKVGSAKTNLNQSSSEQCVVNSGSGGPRRTVRVGALDPSIEASAEAVAGRIARELELGRGAEVGPCTVARCS